MKTSSTKFNPAHYLVATLAFLFLSFTSCDHQKKAIRSLDPTLQKCWTHSYEEQNEQEENEIFRPCDYQDFPASRYRNRYIFDENQECRYLVLAPNDAHYMENGSWELTEPGQIIIRDENNQLVAKLKIITLEEDLLVLKREN